MENIKICVPVIGNTLKEFLKNLEKVQEVSEMIELRVDKIKNLSENDLQLIRKKTIKEAIFTSRRKEIILKALDLGFDYVDVDLSLISKIKLPKELKTKIIISFHDYKKTPNIQELTLTINRMRECNVEILKIATMVNKTQDINNLFKTLLSKKQDEKMIVIGMGKKGQIIRVLGPFLGSFLTFASTQYGESAPGQIELEKIKNLYKLLVPNP